LPPDTPVRSASTKDVFPDMLIRKEQSPFPNTSGGATVNRNVVTTLHPKTYFEQHPEQCEQSQVRERLFRPAPPTSPTSYIDGTLVERSMSHYKENKLFQFLSTQFGEDESLRLMKLYQVGTANHWQGSTVFWQTDTHGKVRTGKIMLYNPATGRRIKEPHNHITWVHSILHKRRI